MSKISEMTREKWINSTFPEWGTWLTEEIEGWDVKPGSVAMWWLGCVGMWFKTPGGANITVDFWAGNGKRSHGDGKMKVGHQMANMAGVRAMQPNLRNVPFVIDPFKIQGLDAVLATHLHQDHMSAELAAQVVNTGMTTVNDKGETREQCIVVKPGDSVKIKDLEIVALDAFDRTILVTTDSTGADREELYGKCPLDMDEKAVNFLIKTPGGNIYHSGDSHYSIYFAKHGKDYDIDVATAAFGLNPVGIQDKMECTDVLRMAEALNCKVVIPIHHDVWSNFQADVNEIKVIWEMRKDRLDYKFHPFFWEVGGHYVYPDDKDKFAYHHDRGFHDCFEYPQNVPFRSVL